MMRMAQVYKAMLEYSWLLLPVGLVCGPSENRRIPAQAQ